MSRGRGLVSSTTEPYTDSCSMTQLRLFCLAVIIRWVCLRIRSSVPSLRSYRPLSIYVNLCVIDLTVSREGGARSGGAFPVAIGLLSRHSDTGLGVVFFRPANPDGREQTHFQDLYPHGGMVRCCVCSVETLSITEFRNQNLTATFVQQSRTRYHVTPGDGANPSARIHNVCFFFHMEIHLTSACMTRKAHFDLATSGRDQLQLVMSQALGGIYYHVDPVGLYQRQNGFRT